jgi:hypothetical protein
MAFNSSVSRRAGVRRRLASLWRRWPEASGAAVPSRPPAAAVAYLVQGGRRCPGVLAGPTVGPQG